MNKLFEEHYDELQALINCIKVGIFIADSRGVVLMLNDESEKTGGMTKKELVGKTMEELIEMGYVTESSVVRAIHSGREESIIQELGVGGQMYITGVPYRENEILTMVVCTERDITETINLKELLREKEAITEKYESELEYFRRREKSSGKLIVAEDADMKAIVEMAMRIAGLDTTVFLKGESGTGKEVLANLLHQCSDRKNGPFIKINCAAIPEKLLESEFFGYESGAFTGADAGGKAGIFELANHGTLFLDEISELPIQMQSKLLRVLQEKEVMRIGGQQVIPVNVRIVAASNVDLRRAMKEGLFREDLYYRINIVPLEIPPLRNRKADIAPLARYFVEQFNAEYHLNKILEEDAIEVLKEYSWPGNVRELRNILERIVISFDGDEITRHQIAGQLGIEVKAEHVAKGRESVEHLDKMIEKFEKQLLENLMKEYKNGSEVARLLGVNKSTISRKLKKYGIPVKE